MFTSKNSSLNKKKIIDSIEISMEYNENDSLNGLDADQITRYLDIKYRDKSIKSIRVESKDEIRHPILNYFYYMNNEDKSALISDLSDEEKKRRCIIS